MSPEDIDKAFEEYIAMRAIGRKMEITANHVAQLRHRLQNNLPISMEKKIELLRKAGWRPDDQLYSQKDLVAAVTFALRSGESAKSKGAEYLVEKFLSKKTATK